MSPPSDGTSNNQPPSKKKKLGRTSVHDEFTRGRGMGKGGVEKEGCYWHDKHEANICSFNFLKSLEVMKQKVPARFKLD